MIHENSTASKGSKIRDHCTIGANCLIKSGSIVGRYSKITHKITIGRNACIHPFTLINANVPTWAVVHSFVNLPEGTSLEDGAIVMRSPSSKELYVRSPPIDKIPETNM